MAEPVSSGTFVLGKLLSGVSGFFGGLSVSFFWQPKKLHQYGKFAAGAIVGGISVTSAAVLSGFAAKAAGMDFSNSDVALAMGYIVGISSVGIISFLANFFDKREDRDILEIVKEVRSGNLVPARKTTRKTASKTTRK